MDEVILGDCLEVMRGFKDKQFDLVLTDPPYGINVENNYAIGGRNDKAKDETIDWDSSVPPQNTLMRCAE